MKRGTPEHPKTKHLMRLLEIPLYSAIGILESLFHITAKYTPRGNIGNFDDGAIAAAIDWKGDPTELVRCLVKAGWLDEDETHRLLIHDWAEHCEEGVKKTLAYRGEDFCNASRQNENESGKSTETLDGCVTFPEISSLPKPKPLPKPLPLKTSQEGHGARSRTNGKQNFVGDLAGDPAEWKRFPQLPTSCKYDHYPSPFPEKDLDHRGRLRGEYSQHPSGLEGELSHRLYFVKKGKPEVLLVAYPDAAWIDEVEIREQLKRDLEDLDLEPWAAICAKLKKSTVRAEVEEMLQQRIGEVLND